jgi:hypothetical protein
MTITLWYLDVLTVMIEFWITICTLNNADQQQDNNTLWNLHLQDIFVPTVYNISTKKRLVISSCIDITTITIRQLLLLMEKTRSEYVTGEKTAYR